MGQAAALKYEKSVTDTAVPSSVTGTRAKDVRSLIKGTSESKLDFPSDGYRARIDPYRGVTGRSAINAIATGRALPAGSRRPLPPVIINVHGAGSIHSGKRMALQDGRHRLEAAQAAGATQMRARIRVYGPRGGILWQGDRIIRVPKADPSTKRERA